MRVDRVVLRTCARVDKVSALALTDGMVWSARGWTSEGLLDEEVPTDAQLAEAAGGASGDEYAATQPPGAELALPSSPPGAAPAPRQVA